MGVLLIFYVYMVYYMCMDPVYNGIWHLFLPTTFIAQEGIVYLLIISISCFTLYVLIKYVYYTSGLISQWIICCKVISLELRRFYLTPS